jgi:hypothetical protein
LGLEHSKEGIMLVDWKYVYKRRSWTSASILNSLDDKSWESFKGYFNERKIVCPPKKEFDNAKKTMASKIETPKPKTGKKPSNKTGKKKPRTSRVKK